MKNLNTLIEFLWKLSTSSHKKLYLQIFIYCKKKFTIVVLHGIQEKSPIQHHKCIYINSSINHGSIGILAASRIRRESFTWNHSSLVLPVFLLVVDERLPRTSDTVPIFSEYC